MLAQRIRLCTKEMTWRSNRTVPQEFVSGRDGELIISTVPPSKTHMHNTHTHTRACTFKTEKYQLRIGGFSTSVTIQAVREESRVEFESLWCALTSFMVKLFCSQRHSIMLILLQGEEGGERRREEEKGSRSTCRQNPWSGPGARSSTVLQPLGGIPGRPRRSLPSALGEPKAGAEAPSPHFLSAVLPQRDPVTPLCTSEQTLGGWGSAWWRWWWGTGHCCRARCRGNRRAASPAGRSLTPAKRARVGGTALGRRAGCDPERGLWLPGPFWFLARTPACISPNTCSAPSPFLHQTHPNCLW